jgi:hypothetical protein
LKSTELLAQDYRAETRFSVLSSLSAGSRYAGLTWRSTSIKGAFPDMYACVVDFANERLMVIKFYSGSGGGESVYKESPLGSVKGSGPFRLRIETVGSAHACAIVAPSGPSLSLANTYHPQGTVGFVVRGAEVCFDYLWVVAP